VASTAQHGIPFGPSVVAGQRAVPSESDTNHDSMKLGHQLGVVTVTYNSAVVLPDFLDSLRQQTNRSFRVYVIDNASSDASVAALAAASDIEMVITRNVNNLGIAEGNNQGIRQAEADGCTHVVLLNNDTVFGPELFQTLLEVAESGNWPIVIPKIHYYDRPRTIWCAGGRFVPWRGYTGGHYGDGELDTGQYDFERSVDYSPTCCMLVKMRVFETVGLMDERYFVYYDDTDFCLRAMRCGIKIRYTYKTELQHKVGSLTGGESSPFTARMVARNRVYYLRKNFGGATRAWFYSFYVVYLTSRWLTGRDSWARYKLKVRAFVEGFSV
jgi:GT2 family glycosyltransferase